MSATPAPQRRYAPRLPPEERREQLLDAALDLIAESGYRVVYELFANAGELAQALLEREEGRALADLAGALPAATPDADADAVLSHGVDAFLEAVHANPARWRLILMPTDGTPAMVRDHVARGRATVAARLEALVTWGVERRGGPADLDAELTAQAIMALAEGAARLVLTDPERYPPGRLSEFSAKLVKGLGS
jgi:AcrR family transcriptional regulator